MTTARRAYINKSYNQYVDDECLEYRSVPMAVVNTILKVKHKVSDFTGVKRVFNNIPARPINLNALATTIARMNNLPYSAVSSISSKISQEEIQAVKRFVKGNKDPFEEIVAFAPQKYVAEQPTSSTTGIRLKGNGSSTPTTVSIGSKREIELLMGDESQTYNTPVSRPNPRLPNPVKDAFFDPPPAYSTRSSPSGSSTQPSPEPERMLFKSQKGTKNIQRVLNEPDTSRVLSFMEQIPVTQSRIAELKEARIEVKNTNRDAIFGKHLTYEYSL